MGRLTSQRRERERLGDEVVHTSLQTCLARARHGTGRDCQNRNAPLGSFDRPDLPSCFEPVEIGHMAIHQH